MLLQLSVPRNTGSEIVADTIHLPSCVHESSAKWRGLHFISHVTGLFPYLNIKFSESSFEQQDKCTEQFPDSPIH